MVFNTFWGLVTNGVFALHQEMGVYLNSMGSDSEQHTPDILVTT